MYLDYLWRPGLTYQIWPAAHFWPAPVLKFGAWFLPGGYITWGLLRSLEVWLEDGDPLGNFLHCPPLLIMPQHRATLQDCATAIYKSLGTFLTSLKHAGIDSPATEPTESN